MTRHSRLVAHLRQFVLLGMVAGGAVAADPPTGRLKHESFDRDPAWEGVNNRSAHGQEPRRIRQDFGYSAGTRHAGGGAAGELGGLVTPAGEAAFYGKPIESVTLEQPLRASGVLTVGPGGTHLLLGFFQAKSVHEWRTPNTLALRLNARGEQKFFAYVEYCTARWRAGGDSTPFPSTIDPATGRWNLVGFDCGKSYRWTLTYDPRAADGRGVLTATIGDATAICELDPEHRADGATFDRFGLLNVVKSADSGSPIWLDDLSINGGPPETFARDPGWDGHRNRESWPSRRVRPWFDFGFSDTQFAGGRSRGELGGQIFRGDCRYPERMGCYGDRLAALSLERPLFAAGKITLRRGVSDSTTLFGFYHSQASMKSNPAQTDGLPASVVGLHVEGPSRDGFRLYPVLRPQSGGGRVGNVSDFPVILPDGASHDWSFRYIPQGPDGRAQITVTLDEKSGTFTLDLDEQARATPFDRFGIITSWIDGNSQDVYWDDLTYTASQEP